MGTGAEGMGNTDGGGTLVIVRAGDHWSFKMSRQILPSGSTFGWDILVTNCTLGGVKG